MNINVGRVLEQAVRMERIGISELSRKLNVSRRTIYNWFKQEDLNPNIILKVGYVIGHDFTEDLPETFIRNHRHIFETENSSILKEIAAENNSVYFWMNKYVALLEKYNEVLNHISENSKSQQHSNEIDR
jgi:DNA-binding XRE family transcriptional regulator